MTFFNLIVFLFYFSLTSVNASLVRDTILCKNNSLEKLIDVKYNNLHFNGYDTYFQLVFGNDIEGCNEMKSCSGTNCEVHNNRKNFFLATLLYEFLPCLTVNTNAAKLNFQKRYASQIYLHLAHPGYCILDPVYSNFINFLFDKENAVRSSVCCRLSANDTAGTKYDTCMDKIFSKNVFSHYYGLINNSYSASQSLAVFNYENDDDIDSIINDISRFDVLTVQKKTAKSFTVPMAKELMTSNLLMNNYGRVVRELKHRIFNYCKEKIHQKLEKDQFEQKFLTFIVRCKGDQYGGSDNSLHQTEIDFCVSIENFYTFIRCFIIVISCVVNVYMLLTLEMSNKMVETISISLIRMLFVSNVIFLITDIWFIIESFFPFVKPGNNFHFVQINEQFDGELWENLTYYINMESVRMTMDFRVEDVNFDLTKRSSRGIVIRALLVVQNVLLNISRTYAGSINFCVMFFVLFDLRRSYHGILKSRVLFWFKVVLVSMFVLVTALYIASGTLQFYVLHKVNEHVSNTNSDLPKVFDIYSHLLRFHTYLMLLFYILTSFVIIFVMTYYKIKQIIYPLASKNVMLEMSRTMRSLFLASAVYIISNFIVTVTEICFLMTPINDLVPHNIANATYQYHWLYLFVYADIIIHPIILINRLTVMYDTHIKFRRAIHKFKFGEYISDFILRIHHKFYPTADFNNGFIRAQYRQNQRPKPPQIVADTDDSVRHRATRRPTDSELQDMLKILEFQKNAPHLI